MFTRSTQKVQIISHKLVIRPTIKCFLTDNTLKMTKSVQLINKTAGKIDQHLFTSAEIGRLSMNEVPSLNPIRKIHDICTDRWLATTSNEST